MDEIKYYTPDEITHKGKSLREILEAHAIWVLSKGKSGSRADLTRAHIALADLRGANLREADLKGAHLDAANLCEADLSGAELGSADLTGADLSGVNLSNAWLIFAVLRGVNLTSASLKEAVFGNTVVGECDLRDVIGLETVQHLGPSTIGIDTIFRSQGRIPEAFLQGAGVPDIFITYAKSLVENPIEFYSCFLSHSHQDQEFCERVYADLRTRDVRCWYFPEDATLGKSVWGEIDRSIRIYDKLVVVCSEQSLKSGPVIREIERALQREDQEKKEILFPIRIDDYLFDKWDHPRKADVIARVVGDFRGWKDHEQYKKNFDKLLTALNRKPADRP